MPPKKAGKGRGKGGQSTLFSFLKVSDSGGSKDSKGGNPDTSETTATRTEQSEVHETVPDAGKATTSQGESLREMADNRGQSDDVSQISSKTSESGTTATAGDTGAKDTTASGGAKPKRYKFQESWRIGNNWLRYDSVKHSMYCISCRGFDKSKKPNAFREAKGCTSIRLCNVESHKNSEAHKLAVKAEEISKTVTEDRPLEKHLTKLDKTRCEKMKKYFKTSFYCAEYGRPFTDFKSLMELQLHNFADSKIADQFTSYRSDKQCKTFIDFIAADLLEKDVTTKLDQDCFISILADGSTDRGTSELELIYISMLQDNRPVTQYVKLASVPKANAENIAKKLIDTLTDDIKLADWRNNLVACCFDGASVMLGCKSGVSARLAKEAPHIIPIHCCAHRLELAIKNIDNCLIKEVENVVQECYKFYKWSPKNWGELQSTAKVLEIKVKRPSKLVGVRWLAHHYGAIEVVRYNWPGMVMHLNNLACSTAAEASLKKREEAMEMLDMIRALTFVFMMNFLCAYLTIMKDLSLTLQRNDITVDRVVERIKSVKTSLRKIQTEKELIKIVDRDITISSNDDDADDETDEVTVKYRGETIGIKAQQRRDTRAAGQSDQTSTKETVNQAKDQVKAAAQVVINETIQNIDDRFESFVSHKIIKAAYIINPQNWPTDADLLESYGDEELEDIYVHYKTLLEARHVDLSLAKLQWYEMKQHIKRIWQKQKVDDLWTSILGNEDLAERYKDMLPIIRILLVLPVHTANVERGFSQVNVIKTEKRTRLQRKSLSSLLTIKLNKRHYRDYDPMGAIVKWSPLHLPDKKRRRPDTKPYGKRRKVQPKGSSVDPKSQSSDSEDHDADDLAQSGNVSASTQTDESDFDVPSTSGGGLAKLADEMIASDSAAWDSTDSEMEL